MTLLPSNPWRMLLALCSHFLYPVRQQGQAQGQTENGEASSRGSDGKYELFSQVDEIVKRELLQLVQCELGFSCVLQACVHMHGHILWFLGLLLSFVCFGVCGCLSAFLSAGVCSCVWV